MDATNYNYGDNKRINPNTKLGDVNEIDPDFEIQLKDGIDNNGETYPKNIKITDYINNQNGLDNEVVLKTHSDENFKDVVETLDNDNVICDDFSNKKKFGYFA
jgi:hypothetical protein